MVFGITLYSLTGQVMHSTLFAHRLGPIGLLIASLGQITLEVVWKWAKWGEPMMPARHCPEPAGRQGVSPSSPVTARSKCPRLTPPSFPGTFCHLQLNSLVDSRWRPFSPENWDFLVRSCPSGQLILVIVCWGGGGGSRKTSGSVEGYEN